MSDELEKQLKELDRLLEKGLITREEHERLRKETLSRHVSQPSSDPFAAVSESKGNKDTVFTLKAGDEIGPEDQRFILQEILGQGGMGQVWLARDLQEETALGGGRESFKAVKVLPPELLNDKRSMAGLEREALRASKLNHAGVVNVFGLRKDPRRRMPFLIMEALEGHDLDEELTQAEASGQNGVGWARMLAILGPVARTLDEIYDDYDGLIHRDLKPGNIFLSPNGKSKILDFGLAYQLRRSSQRLSKETGDTSSGTPDYMPPEAFAHGEPDRRQDVYALACIAYELLTGSPPYPREAVRDRPRDLYPDKPNRITGEQWEALMRGMAYRKEDRPETTGSLVEQLRQAGSKRTRSKHAQNSNPQEDFNSIKKGGSKTLIYILISVVLLGGSATAFFLINPQLESPNEEQQTQAELPTALETQEKQQELAEQKRREQELAEVEKRKKQVLEEQENKEEQAWAEQEKQKRLEQEAAINILQPEMQIIKGGCFMMGSPLGEPERRSNEKQHQVCVDDFKIGKYEVTFAEYDRFVKATSREKPDDEGWGHGQQPVINVSWIDATEYAEWLSEETGLSFRLPTEAEWEYAARAGTETPFYTGGCISTSQASYNGNFDYNGCGANTGIYLNKPQSVGSYPANPWGLHDFAGNVAEWTGSVFDASYDGAEQRSSRKNDNSKRVLRGGTFGSKPGLLRSAFRAEYEPYNSNKPIGFRLAQD